MKEVKIEIPKGYEIDKELSTFEKIVFKESKGFPKTWEELEKVCCFDTPELRAANEAMKKLSQLKKVYNGDWVADWIDATRKYVIFYSEGQIIKDWFCNRSYFLSFKDEDTRDLFLENFRDLIEKAKPLMS
jgi:hypothetical protein